MSGVEYNYYTVLQVSPWSLKPRIASRRITHSKLIYTISKHSHRLQVENTGHRSLNHKSKTGSQFVHKTVNSKRNRVKGYNSADHSWHTHHIFHEEIRKSNANALCEFCRRWETTLVTFQRLTVCSIVLSWIVCATVSFLGVIRDRKVVVPQCRFLG